MPESDGAAANPIPTLSAQMGRGDVFAEKCPSREVLKHVTSRWGVLEGRPGIARNPQKNNLIYCL